MDQHANAAEEDGNQSQNPKEHALCTQHTFQQVATEEREAHRYMDVKNNNNE